MKEENKKITKHDFYFEVPLYEQVSMQDIEDKIFDGDVDAYSAKNKIDTTYKISASRMSHYEYEDFYNYFKVTLTCKRKDNDILKYFVLIQGASLIKVGQYPSLADIQFAQIGKKYDKLLSKEDLTELKRAIGLAAHGVGAGSFVYLRRIFEKLIMKTFTENSSNLTLNKEEFKKLRMIDKIESLQDFLPKQLLEMKEIYGILSNGVHDLTEDQCRKYFPALKLSIELILDDRIEMEKKKRKDEQVKSAIKEISKELKN